MRKLILMVLLVCVAAACGGDDPVGPGSSPVGTYQLASINASTLPVKDRFDREVVEGSLALGRDGTFTASTTTRFQDFPVGNFVTETETESGTYVHLGGVIRLASPEREIEAAYDGASITINAGPTVVVYRR